MELIAVCEQVTLTITEEEEAATILRWQPKIRVKVQPGLFSEQAE